MKILFGVLWYVGMDLYSYIGYESIVHNSKENNISLTQ